ncbi:MAG: transporter substrate-binding domain-containing protein [Epsilonproteobacteria bacterium]|nr:transporter substrate-binding domain-containing protein [Campylobacterota bacterium]
MIRKNTYQKKSIFIAFFLFCIQLQLYAQPSLFNEEELSYLAKKKYLTICIDPNWMPYDALIENKHTGINSAFLKITSDKLGIPIHVVPTSSWEMSQNFAKKRRCDLLSLAGITEERKSYLKFTDPYFDVMIILATIGDESTTIDIEAIEDEAIGIVENHTYLDTIETNYPSINLVKFSTLKQAQVALKQKKIYALIENLPTIGYEIQKGEYDDLRVSGTLKEKLRLGFGVRNDQAILFNIMQKISQSFDLHQKQEIQNRWFAVRYQKQINKKLLYKVIIAFTFVLLLFLLRYIIIHKTNKNLSKRVQEEVQKSQEKDRILFEQNKLAVMGEMLDNISHQWRQPLAEINASVMMIDHRLHQTDMIDKAIEKELLSIEQVTQYMSNTIDDFRNFYGKDQEELSCNIQECLRRASSILSASLQCHNIDLVFHHQKPIYVKASSMKLQQIIIIILSNAKDILVERHIENPKINIDLVLTQTHCTLNICDNGGGIEIENLEKVFEPYFTTNKKSQGRGLGLYIAKTLSKDIQGTLQTHNKFKGACFALTLKRTY